MFRIILTITVLFLALNSYVFSQTDQKKLLRDLLDLPAPAPFDRKPIEPVSSNPILPYLVSNKVPPDNAPIEVLLFYWGRYSYQRADSTREKPSDVVIGRIFEEIRTDPSKLRTYINLLPAEKEYVEFAKEYYDEKIGQVTNTPEVDYEEMFKPRKSVSEAIAAAEEITSKENSPTSEVSEYELNGIKDWLTTNSKYFSDDLLKLARKLKESNNYVQEKESLINLAKVDWEKAEPLVKRFFEDKSKPALVAVAAWSYYVHFIREDKERDAAKYRRVLQDIVENKEFAAGVRDLALDALVMEKEFDGRDDWYISLFEDETLYDLDNYTGLKTLMDFDSAEKWIPKMIDLVGHSNPKVRKVAVRNLTILLGKSDEKNDKLILRALLPWLSDRKWADTDEGRTKLIDAYGRVSIPESVPGLILIVQNEKPEISEAEDAANDAMRRAGDKLKEAGDKMKEGASKLKDAVDKIKEAPAITREISVVKRLSDTQTSAIAALAKYKDSRAIPVLKGALSETTVPYQRGPIIAAIIESDGYNLSELLNSLEAIAKKVSADENIESIDDIYYGSLNSDYTADEMIGAVLINVGSENDELVRLVIQRTKTLQKTAPKVAAVFKQLLQKWENKVIDVERLNSISNNTADAGMILKALTDRSRLRKQYPNIIFSMRGKSGAAAGIAACILENQSELLNAANSGDINTKISAYACARLMRLLLPIEPAGALLKNSNSLLALAAERYLIAEDSPRSRNLILAKYPNEAKILGATNAFVPNEKISVNLNLVSSFIRSLDTYGYYYNVSDKSLKKSQNKLRDEIKSNQDLLGIYAFLLNDSSGHKVLRIYKDKAVYSWYEDDARFRERIVTQEELKLIYKYVTDNDIQNMRPVMSGCHHGCPTREFVMFGRSGGRRIFLYAGRTYPQPLYGLEMIFTSLEQGESKLRYHLQDKIAGLEVILDEKDIKAVSLSKEGDKLRVLVLDEKKQQEISEEISESARNAQASLNYDDFEDNRSEYYRRSNEIDEEIEKIRIERATEPYDWRIVDGTKLGEKTPQPIDDYTIDFEGKFPEVAILEEPNSKFKARTSEFEIRVGDYDNDGLWKVFPNGLTTQISKEDYLNDIIVSDDGKWAILSKNSDDFLFNSLVRLNLQSGKEYHINIPKTLFVSPVAYIKSHDKFLISSAEVKDLKEVPPYLRRQILRTVGKEAIKEIQSGYFLFDANSGSIKPIKGEFAPLEQIEARNLQRTSETDVFWAAIPNAKKKLTRIGRYNTRTFKFEEIMQIPEIKLSSMNIWVDEKDKKIYFIYEGHLLSLPLKDKKSDQ